MKLADQNVEIPDQWFNIIPALPEAPPPPLDPDDGSPSRIALQQRIRLAALRAQDHAREAMIDIPARVRELYQEIGRPTRLVRARRLEAYLGTPAKIFLKREDTLPTGSFKLNSALAQAYYAAAAGVPGVVTETGAGQWGHAVAYACRLFGLRSLIFWADVSARQKPERGMLIRMLGGQILASPSGQTEPGRALQARGDIGSLGTAIGEAIAFARDNPDHCYLSGSNHPHVLLHQSVIGLETQRQLAALGEEADVLVACVGGGSNLGGFMGPFLPRRARSRPLRMIAAEADTAPRLTRGQWRYDHADPLGLTPLSRSYTLGRDYRLPETHIGGLRQHNGSPVIGVLHQHKILEPRAYSEAEVFAAGELLLREEGVLAAPESCHAIRAAIEVALEAEQRQRRDTIVVCVSGSGVLDLAGYRAHAAARNER